MSQTYEKSMYYTLKVLTVPSLAASYYFGNELVKNVLNYNTEQFFVVGGISLLCGCTE